MGCAEPIAGVRSEVRVSLVNDAIRLMSCAMVWTTGACRQPPNEYSKSTPTVVPHN